MIIYKIWMLILKILWNKKITLELGGNAAVVLDDDIDIKAVATQLATSANSYAGQSCCSAQRIYIHQKIYEDFSKIFLEEVRKLPAGDPNRPETIIGPVIDEDSAKRIETWIAQALGSGAECLLGGPRVGTFIPPHILANVPASSEICTEEIFGPVVLIQSVPTFEEGLRQAQTTRYGLRSSAYTNKMNSLFEAQKALRAGGVMINLPPTYRVDSAPFGGVGASGVGIEGPRWALEFFSEKRLIAYAPPPKS
jgi:acyl-CoA reductase-like NAD-dependent aldehyde dehydrogenase